MGDSSRYRVWLACRVPFSLALSTIVSFSVSGCKGDAAGPGAGDFRIHVESGQYQFGVPGSSLPAPFQVLVTNANTGRPVRGAQVTWRIRQGPAGSLDAQTTTTNADGLSTNGLHVGPDTGTFVIEASVDAIVGEPAIFHARAVLAPVIESVSPNAAAGGDTLILNGRNFSANAWENDVLIGGLPGLVTSAEPTRLRVVVPECVPAREAEVTVALGEVVGTSVQVDLLGGPTQPVTMQRGDVLHALDAACLVFPGGPNATSYLITVQNATSVARQPMPFRLGGLAGIDIAAAALSPRPVFTRTVHSDFPAEWEARLRERERTVVAAAEFRPAPEPMVLGATEPPAIGERREFQVLNKDHGFTRVTAQVVHVTDHAILYADVNSPSSGGFTPADFEYFGELFDDVIYPTVTSIYGPPSDLDGNGRVLILFTPVVNEMTPRNSNDSFIAGFFYGVDLLPSENGSNAAEIFYSLVPDPEALHGDRRTRNELRTWVPPVIAHELQHMIHFNQRILVARASQHEVQWLSEALAHTAEHAVAAELDNRGQSTLANNFKRSNYLRAFYYLEDTGGTSLIAPDVPGSLANRGAGWLFIHFLAGHYGGNDLLFRLTRTTRSGVSNVTFETGKEWHELIGGWSVALWASGAPQLSGVSVAPGHTYSNLSPRTAIQSIGQVFPLNPISLTPSRYADFAVTDTLPSTGVRYLWIDSQAGDPTQLHLAFFGPPPGSPWGAQARAQISILRVR